MKRQSISLALALSLSLAAPMALAQETPAADAATPAAPATEAPAAPPAASAEGPGTTYIKNTFDDWQVQCLRTENGSDPCEMFQVLKDGEGTRTAAISIMQLPKPEGEAVAGATITTPLETLLTRGVGLQIDSQKPLALPFNVCTQGGCFANVLLKPADLDLFKKGNKIAMTVVAAAAADKPVELTISLKGFTAAFDALAVKPAE
ncbi:invasion associated locus B family protein [Rhodobacter maris]|uniref:Invasion protein IalB n=1 Tax=Rhodobacter maris TaxID=446682 RepID=A0A285RVY7_9RHOB|nr:invasion associated locus B family protein [Rhodobacter maris]SOB98692.1 invasion protein IalB [Rhodobacter maris]